MSRLTTPAGGPTWICLRPLCESSRWRPGVVGVSGVSVAPGGRGPRPSACGRMGGCHPLPVALPQRRQQRRATLLPSHRERVGPWGSQPGLRRRGVSSRSRRPLNRLVARKRRPRGPPTTSAPGQRHRQRRRLPPGRRGRTVRKTGGRAGRRAGRKVRSRRAGRQARSHGSPWTVSPPARCTPCRGTTVRI